MKLRGLLACCAALALLAGCRADREQPMVKFAPGMFESVPYDAYDPNPALPGGITFLPPPEGTVPVGWSTFPYGPSEEEAIAAGRELTNPHEATEENLARGELVYATFCLVCHGPDGEGDGSVIGQGRFPNPPNLHARKSLTLPDGRMFHILTHGQGVMPGYAGQVRPEDRWMAILYVRRLQEDRLDGPLPPPLLDPPASPDPSAIDDAGGADEETSS